MEETSEVYPPEEYDPYQVTLEPLTVWVETSNTGATPAGWSLQEALTLLIKLVQLFDQTQVSGPIKLINIGCWFSAMLLSAPAPS